MEMMYYEDHVDAKTFRKILKEVFPEVALADAVSIANARLRENKIFNCHGEGKHGKL